VTSIVLALALGALAPQDKWDKDLGKPAPRLFAGGWVGTPVSLDALRKSDVAEDPAGGTIARPAGAVGGNTVVLAFWNADVPC
jgi:hypothetical protein